MLFTYPGACTQLESGRGASRDVGLSVDSSPVDLLVFLAEGLALGVFGVAGVGEVISLTPLTSLLVGLGVRVRLRFFKCNPEGPATGESV